jgi:predicted nucleic acid-binding Zn ribbon protein
MREASDAMGLVRADLCERLAELRRASERSGDLLGRVVAIRQQAAAYGLQPVVQLAEAFERAVRDSRGRGAPPASLYLDRLHDAIGCPAGDAAAAQAMMASVSVRLGA